VGVVLIHPKVPEAVGSAPASATSGAASRYHRKRDPLVSREIRGQGRDSPQQRPARASCAFITLVGSALAAPVIRTAIMVRIHSGRAVWNGYRPVRVCY
jgi:hypothetical protein